MPRVDFLGSGKSAEAPAGTDLLLAARQAGLEIDAECGGQGSCGKCLVHIVQGAVTANSIGLLAKQAIDEGYVLACRARLADSPVTVEIPAAALAAELLLAEADESYLVDAQWLADKLASDALAAKRWLRVAAPRFEDGLSDFDRLCRAVQANEADQRVTCSTRTLRQLAAAVRAQDGGVTATLFRDGPTLHVIDIAPGDQSASDYGVAIDLGTTTVAAQLIDLARRAILATRTAYNDQIACGLDIISRIEYARRSGGLEELRARAAGSINQLLDHLCHTLGVESASIASAAISGNTTMIHLLLGLNPEHIRLEPYTPTVLRVPPLTAEEVGLAIHPEARIHVAPAVGSYVGGDITAGLLCTDLATDTEDLSLFIDVGTNGELVVGNRDFLLGCACSAGPAFEGGGIDSGMRAARGAIDKVRVDPHAGTAQYETIGDAPPLGVCGSGAIALLAQLFLTGWLDPDGRLDRRRPSWAIAADGKSASYTVVPAAASGTGEDIRLSEADIKNLLRAKAAVYSAAALLLRQIGATFDDLARIYVAGGFGRSLDLDQAIVLGLLPDVPRDKFAFLGNASLAGSCLALASTAMRVRQLELAERMTYVSLSTTPEYMEQYTAALFLPHTDLQQFPSIERLRGQRK